MPPPLGDRFAIRGADAAWLVVDRRRGRAVVARLQTRAAARRVAVRLTERLLRRRER